MALSVALCELIGSFVETLLFGIYLAVFPQCFAILRRKKLGGRIVSIFMATMIVTMILVIMHLVVDLTRAFQAFTANMDVAGSPEAYYAIVDTPLVITKNASYVSTTLLADALLIYRTFIVWARNWWILPLPVALFVLDFGMSVWATWSINLAKPGVTVLKSVVFNRLKYFYSATLAVNVLSTLLIGYKIWSTQRGVSGYSVGKMTQGRRASALSIVLESAAIYSAYSICLIATCVASSSAMFFFLNSTPPLIGSIFSYIIIRSSADIHRYNTTIASQQSTGIRSPRSHLSGNPMGSKSPQDGVHVHLQRIVHSDNINIDIDNAHSPGADKFGGQTLGKHGISDAYGV